MACGRSSSRAVGLVAATCLLACSHAWDDYTPADAGSTGSGTAAAGGGSSTSSTSSTSSAGGAGATGATGPGGSTSTGGGGAGPTSPVEYMATVADCIAPTAPDPDECETAQGVGIMTVDQQDHLMLLRHTYIRFDLDDALEGKMVDSVELHVHTGTDTVAGGPASGEVWRVTSFTRPDLFTAAPTKVDSSAIGPNLGVLAVDAEVVWDLPVKIVAAGANVSLGIFPLTTDGIDLENLKGPHAPRLVIAFH